MIKSLLEIYTQLLSFDNREPFNYPAPVRLLNIKMGETAAIVESYSYRKCVFALTTFFLNSLSPGQRAANHAINPIKFGENHCRKQNMPGMLKYK